MEVLEQYKIVVREEGQERAALKALYDEIQSNPDGDHDDFRTAHQKANDELDKERAKLNALGAGPIYQAGIRQWHPRSRRCRPYWSRSSRGSPSVSDRLAVAPLAVAWSRRSLPVALERRCGDFDRLGENLAHRPR